MTPAPGRGMEEWTEDDCVRLSALATTRFTSGPERLLVDRALMAIRAERRRAEEAEKERDEARRLAEFWRGKTEERVAGMAMERLLREARNKMPNCDNSCQPDGACIVRRIDAFLAKRGGGKGRPTDSRGFVHPCGTSALAAEKAIMEEFDGWHAVWCPSVRAGSHQGPCPEGWKWNKSRYGLDPDYTATDGPVTTCREVYEQERGGGEETPPADGGA